MPLPLGSLSRMCERPRQWRSVWFWEKGPSAGEEQRETVPSPGSPLSPPKGLQGPMRASVTGSSLCGSAITAHKWTHAGVAWAADVAVACGLATRAPRARNLGHCKRPRSAYQLAPWRQRFTGASPEGLPPAFGTGSGRHGRPAGEQRCLVRRGGVDDAPVLAVLGRVDLVALGLTRREAVDAGEGHAELVVARALAEDPAPVARHLVLAQGGAEARRAPQEARGQHGHGPPHRSCRGLHQGGGCCVLPGRRERASA